MTVAAHYTAPYDVIHRWVSEKKAIDPKYFEKLASVHTPEYMIITCSDARVSPNQMMVRGVSMSVALAGDH